MTPFSKEPRKEQAADRLGDFGGRYAIAGFLFQILRSVQLGLRVSALINCAAPGGPRMELTLEPIDGGDHQLRLGEREVV